jgi:hypothetical protein
MQVNIKSANKTIKKNSGRKCKLRFIEKTEFEILRQNKAERTERILL